MPARRASVQAIYLRVPRVDWAALVQGEKTEFRTFRRAHTGSAENYRTPTPVVAYSHSTLPGREVDTALLVLEHAWCEPLGLIDAEALEREGFETKAQFRRYWRGRHSNRMKREQRGWRPLAIVNVWQVRPWRDGDELEMGAVLLHRLYGEELDAAGVQLVELSS